MGRFRTATTRDVSTVHAARRRSGYRVKQFDRARDLQNGARLRQSIDCFIPRFFRDAGLTSDIPKPMLRVQGKPILEHIINGLHSAGIREFFIVTGWRAEVVEDYFGDGSKLGIKIQYGRQAVQDGTGKAPELAKNF